MSESALFRNFLATFVFAAFSTPAIASVSERNVVETVTYVGVEINSEEEALTLYRRLKQASKKACDFHGLNIAGSVDRVKETRQCYREALSEAVESIDNEWVSEIHNS